MNTKKEMILETIAERLDAYDDEQITSFMFEFTTDNGEVVHSFCDFLKRKKLLLHQRYENKLYR